MSTRIDRTPMPPVKPPRPDDPPTPHKTPGEIAYEAFEEYFHNPSVWAESTSLYRTAWETAARAVLAIPTPGVTPEPRHRTIDPRVLAEQGVTWTPQPTPIPDPLACRPEDILEEAPRITSGDRQAQYGPPDQDFKRTAAMWSALKGVEFTAQEVALFMICLKLSRQTHQRKRDNWVDIAGYARCGSKCT